MQRVLPVHKELINVRMNLKRCLVTANLKVYLDRKERILRALASAFIFIGTPSGNATSTLPTNYAPIETSLHLSHQLDSLAHPNPLPSWLPHSVRTDAYFHTQALPRKTLALPV